MTTTPDPITAEDVRSIILIAATASFPDRNLEEVERIMSNSIGFSVDMAVQDQYTPDFIRGEVHLANVVNSEDIPRELENEYSDPKNDMGFWRTGIRVSPF
jgi:hypothetical protein